MKNRVDEKPGINIVNNDNFKNNLINNEKPKSKIRKAGEDAGKLLKLIDLGGKPVELLFQNETTYKSVVGGIISLGTLVLVLVYVIWQCLLFIQRTDGTFSTVSAVSSSSIDLNLTDFYYNRSQEMIFGITILDKDSYDYISDLSYFNIKINVVERQSDLSTKKIGTLKQVDCKDSYPFVNNFDSMNSTFYDVFNLDKANCYFLGSYISSTSNNNTETNTTISNTTSNSNQTTGDSLLRRRSLINSKKSRSRRLHTDDIIPIDEFSSNNEKEFIIKGNDASMGQVYLSISVDICSSDYLSDFYDQESVDYTNSMELYEKLLVNYTTIIENLGSANNSNSVLPDKPVEPVKPVLKECKTLDQMRTALNEGINVNYYYSQKDVLINNTIQDPLYNQTSYFNFKLSKRFSKTISLSAQKDYLKDYYNLFSTDPVAEPFFTYKSSTGESLEYIEDSDFGSLSLLSIELKGSSSYLTISRKFKTINEFFVGILAIVQGLLAGLKGFNNFLNTMLMKIDLINKSFFLVEDDSNGGDIMKENEEAIKMKDNKEIADNTNRQLMDKDKRPKKVIPGRIPIQKSEKPRTKMDLNDSGSQYDQYENSNISNLDHTKNNLKKNNNEISNISDNNLNDELNIENDNKNGINDNNLNDLNETDSDKFSTEGDKKEEIKGNEIQMDSKGKILNPYFKDKKLYVPPKMKKFSKFHMSFIELFMQMLPCAKNNKDLANKKKIFNDCGDQIYSYLDVERQVQILREYEELRNVVLSSEEYKILKYLTTPKIIMHDDEVTIAKIEKFNVSDNEIKQDYKFFVRNMNKLVNIPYLSLIEYNLVDLHNTACSMEPTKLKKVEKKNDKNKDKKVELKQIK